MPRKYNNLPNTNRNEQKEKILDILEEIDGFVSDNVEDEKEFWRIIRIVEELQEEIENI